MQTTGRPRMSFGLIPGYRTSTLPTISLLSHTPADNPTQPAEEATTTKQQALDMASLQAIHTQVKTQEAAEEVMEQILAQRTAQLQAQEQEPVTPEELVAKQARRSTTT